MKKIENIIDIELETKNNQAKKIISRNYLNKRRKYYSINK